MTSITAPLAELRALKEHVTSLNDQLVARGFVMASDTRVRLQDAEALIVESETVVPAAADDWVARAIALSVVLRVEAGRPPAAE